ncbi:hypothetical protein J2800_004753 [Caulobacter rhizosphaerae]|uniref:Uncharacterized protein n=1 Tax=Caulobacter rhizosphaerae TaxID=2010972 RepID=A0ABU1N6I5_9CAUL|nr:hypothetical protein [Caulobacter rhizosphaerae]MDR6533983.1 hypothetical protein [Caulobacter rhizosphaerae]
MTKRARAFTALVGAALLVVALPVVASAQPFSGPMGVTGRWAIDLPRSKFNATLTGPPPLSGELDVTIDDGKALAWTLVEIDEAGVAALQFAHAVLDGPPTQAVVNLNLVKISVQRVGQSAVTVTTHGEQGSRHQSMKVTRTDPDTLLVEQDIDGRPGPPDQTLILTRVKP